MKYEKPEVLTFGDEQEVGTSVGGFVFPCSSPDNSGYFHCKVSPGCSINDPAGITMPGASC